MINYNHLSHSSCGFIVYQTLLQLVHFYRRCFKNVRFLGHRVA